MLPGGVIVGEVFVRLVESIVGIPCDGDIGGGILNQSTCNLPFHEPYGFPIRPLVVLEVLSPDVFIEGKLKDIM